jgi:hypothetical protein
MHRLQRILQNFKSATDFMDVTRVGARFTSGDRLRRYQYVCFQSVPFDQRDDQCCR